MKSLFLVAVALLQGPSLVQSHSHVNIMAPKTAFMSSLQKNQRTADGIVKDFSMANRLSTSTKPSKLIASLPNTASSPAESSVAGILGGDNIKLALYLVVWYLGNIYYNLFNKYASLALGKDAHGHSNAHWILSAVQVSSPPHD